MTGNEVTPTYYDEVVFLRVSGFVQQTHAVGRGRAAPLMRSVNGSFGHEAAAEY
jgi:hypothetical protein